MLIPATDLEVLRDHSARLVEASASLETWLASPFGSFIQFTNRRSLTELREYWTQYKDSDVSGKVDASIRRGLLAGFKVLGNTNVAHGARSAGPFCIEAIQAVGYTYRKYWETGVAGGDSGTLARLGVGQKGLANPLFAISSAPSGQFAVHYGTDPLLGFHLAHAFGGFQGNFKRESQPSLQRIGERLVQAAKDQFCDWCRNFGIFVGQRRVQIQLFCGDAANLCHELRSEVALQEPREHARAYTRQWTLQALRLDGHLGQQDSRRSFFDYFDVIDTSNVGDHIGLINLIVATVPLLRPRSTSVLCIESLLAVSKNTTSALPTALCSDVSTFAVLMGLTPMGCLSGITMEAVSNEATLQMVNQSGGSLGRQTQYRLRIHWRSPNGRFSPSLASAREDVPVFRRLAVDAKGLGAYFFSVYKKMFSNEDMSTLMAKMQRPSTQQYVSDMQAYTRAAIVRLICLVETRVSANWPLAIDTFLDLVERDKSLIVGSNSLQELNMHLAMSGAFTVPVLSEGPRRLQHVVGLNLRPRSQDKGLLGDADPPPTVYIIVSIPRQNLRVFTDRKAEEVGTPDIHVSVKQQLGAQQFENCFYSFQCFFGRFPKDYHSKAVPVFEEDAKGWLGIADLIVVCPVPTFGLLVGPRNGLKVSVSLNTSPDNAARFRSQLGFTLVVFETALTDEGRVMVCRDAPHVDTAYSVASQKKWLQASTNVEDPEELPSATFEADYSIKKLQVRTKFSEDSDESKALVNGASVNIKPLDLSTVILEIGNQFSRVLTFPSPVQSQAAKIRIARKSSWIEVEASVHFAPREDPFDTWTGVQQLPRGTTALYCIPRLSLDILPVLPPLTKKGSSWLNLLMTATQTEKERKLVDQSAATSSNALADLKQSLNIMVLGFAGLHPKYPSTQMSAFHLTLSHNQSTDTLVLVSSVRHDLDLGSIVLDAWVLPFTMEKGKTLSLALHRLFSNSNPKPLGVILSDKESALWKRFLPALAERCRTWNHKDGCEYRKKGASIPLSTKEAENPLCSCGEGRTTAEFAKKDKLWAPFAKYVTRVAIAPIFPVPYVESTVLFPEGSMPSSGGSKPTSSAGSKCDHCGKTASDLKACGACGKVRYCGKECQKAGWKTHKVDCKKS